MQTLLVASIPPFSNPSINQRVLAFNSALPDIVSSKVLKVKKVFVDIFSKLTSSDLAEIFIPIKSAITLPKAWDSAIRSVNNSKTPDVITKRVGNDMNDFNADNQSDILGTTVLQWKYGMDDGWHQPSQHVAYSQ